MKTIELTDEQIVIIEDISLRHLEDETNNDSFSQFWTWTKEGKVNEKFFKI